MNVIALDRLRLATIPAAARPTRPGSRMAPGERFLKGPIPLPWLEHALALPGRALHVGIVLWFHAGLTRSAAVSVSMSGFTRYGMSRFTAARGLAALERAGLVRCVRAPGRKPRVEILRVTSPRSEETSR